MNINLPLVMKELPLEQREAVIEEFRKALNVPRTIVPAALVSKNPEHNIWLRNDDDLLAEAEEELYRELISPSMHAMAEVIAALGLANEDIEKSLSDEYMQYEADMLIKGKLKDKVSDLMDISKQKVQDFIKYIQGASSWTKKKLKEIEGILTQKIPDAEKLAEEYSVRAAFIAKIRNKADIEALEMTGAFVDQFPKTIEAASHESLVVNQREKDRLKPIVNPNLKSVPHENTSVIVTEEELEAARKEWNKLKILPLQPQEIRTVENAELRAASKITEVVDRHKAAIKQLVLHAINGRWSSQQLAQALFDQFGDMNRDWRRVAITELAMATNDAYLAGCEEGDQVWVPPVIGACKHCVKYLEGKTFIVTHNHELMGNNYEQEMKYVWVGKTNYGRKQSAWIPAIPLHPHCRHTWHKLSRFYKVIDGKPVLKTSKELIQEERARRGLSPDENLK